jgi:anaerobic ribonucleoside-triphosphate reductase
MTRIQQSESPSDSPEAMKWLLGVMAQLRLRLDEIGKREGIRLQFVQTTDERIRSRFQEAMLRAGYGLDPELDMNLLGVTDQSVPALQREGKLHPFFATGQAGYTLNRGGVQLNGMIKLIQQLATETHVSGMTWVGEGCLCLDCDTRFEDTQCLCQACGSEQIARFERRANGTYNRIDRL